jgi:hypothetical protein
MAMVNVAGSACRAVAARGLSSPMALAAGKAMPAAAAARNSDRRLTAEIEARTGWDGLTGCSFPKVQVN